MGILLKKEFRPEDLLGVWRTGSERCGLIIDGTVVEFNNVASDCALTEFDDRPEFAILQEDVDNYMKIEGLEDFLIEGVWHTHPSNNPYPSDEDMAGLPNLSVRYFTVTETCVSEWSFEEEDYFDFGRETWAITRPRPALVSRVYKAPEDV